MVIQCDTKLFAIFVFYNTDYKDMPVIRTLARFTESFVRILFHGIFFPNMRTLHTGYKNIILENCCHIPYVFYAGYKNMFLDSEYRS